MKKLVCAILSLLLSATFVSCANINSTSSTESHAESAEESKPCFEPSPDASRIIKTQNYKNNGKMGDTDGPAFAVYSNIGYNGASVELNLDDAEINTSLPDGRFVNGYCFLGIDVYEGDYWVNCVDVGLCWSGQNGGWHIFYNIYETLNEYTNGWYESGKKLPRNGSYKMVMTIIEDNYATLTVESLNGNFKDSVKVEVKGAKADGSNTSFLFNTALDYPENTKLDSFGNKSEDWVEITLANTDKGLYLRKLRATNLKLFKNGKEEDWTEDKTSATSIWPDKAVKGFDYSPTEIYLYDGTEYFINLDMNREYGNASVGSARIQKGASLITKLLFVFLLRLFRTKEP